MQVKDLIKKSSHRTIRQENRIQRLSTMLANQIAAGEVIERPASVLKELLENSLDANSTQIDVSIERSGVGLIRVQDNGFGIHKEDLELALSQHATSKISDVTDLEAILSYGFRGEALASIASVSKIRITSCTEQNETGWTIEKTNKYMPSTKEILKPAPRILGTTIEMRDLFYNTPARRKFLRSEKTEMHYIEEVFKRITLSHPEVGFSLKTSEKNIKRYNRCTTQEAYNRRVGMLCGNSFIDNAQYLEAESNGLILRGWLGNETQLRATSDLQYFYVNGRIVRDKGVNHAIRQAYQDICTLGRFPSYILFLELDPAGVDVNVHPTKHEVRFREARTVHAFLTYALGQSLGSLEKQENSFDKNTHFIPESHMVEPSYKAPLARYNAHLVFNDSVQAIRQQPTQENNETFSIENTVENSCSQSEYNTKKALCLLGGSLLLLEEKEGYCIIDVQAIHKKLLAMDLQTIEVSSTEASQDNKYQRPLLMPLPIRLKHSYQVDRLKILQPLCNTLGFFWTETGKDVILLRAAPDIFILNTKIYQHNSRLFEDLFLKLLETKEIEKYKDSHENLKKILIAFLAEHIAQHHILTIEQSMSLLQRADKTNITGNLKIRKFTLETLKRLISS